MTPRAVLSTSWSSDLNDIWQPLYTGSVPADAEGGALILQLESALYSNLSHYCDVGEYYGDYSVEWQTEMNEMYNGSRMGFSSSYYSNTWWYMNQRVIVAYRGSGTLMARIKNSSRPQYPVEIYMVGYFTPEEFVAFDEKMEFDFPVYGDNNMHSYDISGQPWYVGDEATCYLIGRKTDYNCRICAPGWGVDRQGDDNSWKEYSVFWDENGIVKAGNRDVGERMQIPGYFRIPARRGVYPTSKAPFTIAGKPFDSNDQQDKILQQADTDCLFSICRSERIDDDDPSQYESSYYVTMPAPGQTAEPPYRVSSSVGDGRRRVDTYVMPNLDTGEMYIKFNNADYVNSRTQIEYITFIYFGSYVESEGLFLDAPDLGMPSVEQSVGVTMGLPLVYQTKSGDYTWNGTFVMYLSGGSSNADPAVSLGGDVSTTPMGSNIFGPITNRKAQLGGSEHRCVYVRNTSSTETAYGVVVWIENQAKLGNSISLSLDPLGVDGPTQLLPSEYNEPTGVDFVKPTSVNNGLVIGVIPPNTSVPIWMRREGQLLNPYNSEDLVTLAFSVMSNG